MPFPDRVERYLAEIRSGETEAEALRMADATESDLERWRRNREFRDARAEALERRMEPGGWVGEEIPGTRMTRWRPVITQTPGRPSPPPIPPRMRSMRPWEQKPRLFSLTPNHDSCP